MFKYSRVDEALKEKLNSYTNKGEYLLVSDGIKYKEMEYREVLFNKKNLLIQEVKGIVYIDENNNIVQDKNIQKSLARLYYYYEIFFCLDKKNNIFKALRNEEDLHKENKDIELSIKALEFLQKEKIKDTEKIRNILLELPSLRKRTNDLLKEMKSIIENIFNEEDTMSKESFEKVYTIYKEILKLNFKNIKLIYSGIDYYDYIKECVNKKRKSFSIRFNKKLSEPLFKLDYQINYFKKLLKTYNEILCMNERDYLKSVYNSEKHNINERLKILRNKNEK
ncbi:hypothetical protein AAGC94_14045 [Clostridium sporogenes]|uniref:Uncharacterized protein n=3 Tax=Clostridium TaxID=1485 RepID=A0A7X5PD23_CLOSG|nr:MULTISPECIES: hypothetical protein [Clostridium]AJD30395.1 hypothetical protein T258_1957 [Clostridium botulinum Prevot_594]AVP62522.1 hypothetical protein C7M79_18295 [Clostridium botulinum]AKC63931.1 hypothetical protein CLSPO_c32130 [Clostridium sporogenes]AKJ91073.1 hypothetical protein CLSPOx_16080 [Clostridium sporogenes]AVP66222.1 hypothetical protein C3B64_19025 [Clostridium botulinum]